MDSFEAAKVIQRRILKFEPENIARKIVGYVILKGLPTQEMIRLAMAPDTVIRNLIQNAKAAIHLASPPVICPPVLPNPLSGPSSQFPPFMPASEHTLSAPFHYWNSLPMLNKPMTYSDPIPEEYGLHSKFSFDDPLGIGPSDYYRHEAAFADFRDSPNFTDPVKTCHYFIRGFCKHGSSCRFLHVKSFPNVCTNDFGPNSFEVGAEDQTFSPGFLGKLEQDIAELIKSRGGNPVSIASLPMIYYERYGRTLQAEGYLTESQRHGKAGYSLTKLIERLKNRIKLISRPHGQHDVVLVEDAPKYVADQGDRNDPGPVISGSRRIYLTFPAESTFTEEDVSNHFSSFGQVQDVRIPCRQERMFGFVTFASADTVRLILSNEIPHYVRGERVLVKPYREKSKLIDRKYQEQYYYQSHPMDHDSDLEATELESSRLFRGQLMEDRGRALQLEATRLAQLQLSGRDKFQSSYNYFLDVMNNGGSTSDKHTTDNCSGQESAQGLDLPDGPITVGSSISAVIEAPQPSQRS